MKTKLTKKQKINFARRFSMDDWCKICGNSRFEAAFEDGDLELAEIIAWEILAA